jgi:hypothetical protein
MFINSFREALIIVLAFIMSGSIGSQISTLGQETGYSSTTRLEKRLIRQFRLTNADLNRLRPLIQQGNDTVARAYDQCSEKYRDNFISLWDAIRTNRLESEATLPDTLTPKQKRALHSARTDVESQILELWLEDYVNTLSGTLDLDRFQAASIQAFFQMESDKRLSLIIRETEKTVEIGAEWQRLTDEREIYMKAILDTEQYRNYLTLGLPTSWLLG